MPLDFLAQCPGLEGLNAFTRPLTPNDVKSCVIVESAFVEHERCSEEKFAYRLNQTPELCLGLFIKPANTTTDQLIGHIIANKTQSPVVTDGSVEMPTSWETLPPNERVLVNGEVIGNDPQGTNIAIHSVAIIPEYQRGGVGQALVKTYVEYIRSSRDIGQFGRIALLAHDYLIRFYAGAGFENHGQSEAFFAGGGWYNIVIEI